MFADVHPKARRDKQRYKASSSGVPDVVDEEQPTLYEGYTRVAVPRPGGDDVACCQGGKRVIQRRFNVSVPRARVSETAPTLRERSEI